MHVLNLLLYSSDQQTLCGNFRSGLENLLCSETEGLNVFLNLGAVLDPILERQLQAVLSTPDRFLAASIGDLDHLLKSASKHGRAFDAGLISKQRLIDVLVSPFFQLAEKINQVAIWVSCKLDQPSEISEGPDAFNVG